MEIKKQVKTPAKTKPVANLLLVPLNEKELSDVSAGGKIGSL